MTSGRFPFPLVSLRVLCGAPLLLIGLAAVGCGSPVQVCTQCPPIEGRWKLTFGDGVTPSTCQGVTVTLPQGPLEVTRQGSVLSGSLQEVPLAGTLYQTYDFNLVGTQTAGTDGGTAGTDGGTAGLEAENLAGRYVPGVGDGGMPTLVGDWQGSYASSSGGTTRRCSVSRPFTAARP